MSPLFRLAAGLCVAAAPFFIADAAVKDLPVRSVNGHLYHYYKVPSKETVYSICYKLGVSKDDLIRYNPSVGDGLKVGMTIYFPYEGDPTLQTQDSPATHKVERGETIFGISHKYGITEQRLIELNPFLKDGLKAGQTLTVGETTRREAPVPVAAAPEAEQPAATVGEVKGYIVKKNETLYSIAVANGITVAELEAANPGLVTLRTGQVINIPVKQGKDTATVEPEGGAAPVVADSVASAPSDTVAAEQTRGAISVGVVLPFMLAEETPSKEARRVTEFYKGFLMAVDSLRSSGRPIHVSAYDTEGSLVKVKEIIQTPGFDRHTAIIAPDNQAQLAILAEYGKNNGVKVLNSFVVRDDSYLTNPDMVQGNLPSAMMYRKAIGGMVERLRHSTPVFLSFKGVTPDKGEFVAELKSALDSAAIAYTEIAADGTLTAADLAVLGNDGNFTFIPVNSHQPDVNKMMPAVIEWRDKAVTPTVRFFGYPEWTMFRGETLANMHNLNTTVYSRFYTGYDDRRAEALEASFKRWYGTGMESVVPRQGLMGFDAGMFIIRWLGEGTTMYDGVQNGYRLSKAGDDGGAYNDMLYFINFRPGGVIDKTPL